LHETTGEESSCHRQRTHTSDPVFSRRAPKGLSLRIRHECHLGRVRENFAHSASTSSTFTTEEQRLIERRSEPDRHYTHMTTEYGHSVTCGPDGETVGYLEPLDPAGARALTLSALVAPSGDPSDM